MEDGEFEFIGIHWRIVESVRRMWLISARINAVDRNWSTWRPYSVYFSTGELENVYGPICRPARTMFLGDSTSEAWYHEYSWKVQIKQDCKWRSIDCTSAFFTVKISYGFSVHAWVSWKSDGQQHYEQIADTEFHENRDITLESAVRNWFAPPN